MKWLVILIFWAIFCLIMNPINKAIKRNVGNRWLAFIIYFTIAFVIFVALYTIADLLGIDSV